MINLNELDELIDNTRKTLMFLEDYRARILGVHYMTNANTAEDIMFRSIETVSGISKTILLGKSRDANLVMYRFIGMNILLNKIKMSPTNIARIFYKEHSMIYHAKKAYNNWIDTNDTAITRYNQVNDVFDRIIKIIKGTLKNIDDEKTN